MSGCKQLETLGLALLGVGDLSREGSVFSKEPNKATERLEGRSTLLSLEGLLEASQSAAERRPWRRGSFGSSPKNNGLRRGPGEELCLRPGLSSELGKSFAKIDVDFAANGKCFRWR